MLRTEEDLPPLFGVPTAIKDLTPTAGVRTTFGSAAFADFVPTVDADVVRLLRAAGLISLGKTTTSEFGLSLHAESEVAPPARNPWAPGNTAGGSSGGAAAAVAAGLVAVAHGNDGGGSVRIPASICGLMGFKPSRGVVSNGPLGFGGLGLPTNGVLGRTVADVAALLDVMAVPQPGEPFPVPPRPDGGFLAAARRPSSSRCASAGSPRRCSRTPRSTRRAWPRWTRPPTCWCGPVTRWWTCPACSDVELEQRFETLWAAMATQSLVPPGREAGCSR